MLDRQLHKEWLASLKAGDQVAIGGNSRYGHPPEILTIQRLTVTQFVVAVGSGREERYHRDNGKKVGGKSYLDTIEPVTEQVHAAIKLYGDRQWLNGITWRSDKIDAIPAPVIAAMRAAYDKAMAEHAAARAEVGNV